ncbi:hypothetical protein SAMN04487974_10971 [Pelagibacterium luteolum]|uniref:Uncharacterized protein n=1 Tax=Pelagibacterium luteolum TaxID=440168 RepID=A0A1G7XEW6_9HYPH|nr:hypothetical protein SAMN04487974_10971 [Pelagibacterium luteolum]
MIKVSNCSSAATRVAERSQTCSSRRHVQSAKAEALRPVSLSESFNAGSPAPFAMSLFIKTNIVALQVSKEDLVDHIVLRVDVEDAFAFG